ncbi:HdeD family acid-resistance protein [Ktedonospora formicarum]|uniref:Membrane protein n=1 Tax=Ktedonospora formicarum TaxID=2778364 RepID=A0A8J3MQ31_9CHLR|nr:HdeD family acid-resistance protein [Ktedonospora formicarum]GHO42356.1 membrane protein [Ktedonospora formicarum]
MQRWGRPAQQDSFTAPQSTIWMAIRGIIAILFGIAALVWPGLTLFILIYLFAAYVLVDGIFAVIASFQGRRYTRYWWVIFIEGLIGIAIGIIAFSSPGLTAVALLFLIATWAILTGIFELINAFSGRRPAESEWAMGIAGALSIVLGILLFAQPGAGLLTIVWLIGIYAIVWGLVLIARSFQRRAPSTGTPSRV